MITRGIDDGVETIGSLIAVRGMDMKIFESVTLELPWKNNKQMISCIPKGIYKCSVKPFYTTKMYQLLEVPQRFGIFIHNGNYYHDILGCILIGVECTDIDKDGHIDVTSSKDTIKKFMEFYAGSDFILEIV